MWEMARPDDPDVLPLGHRLLRAVSERIRWRDELNAARERVGADPAISKGLGNRSDAVDKEVN
jgi:hypothetical protein